MHTSRSSTSCSKSSLRLSTSQESIRYLCRGTSLNFRVSWISQAQQPLSETSTSTTDLNHSFMTSDVELSKVRALLVSVRDAPVNTADATDDILGPIYSYLMKIPPSPSDNTYHWFCSRAQQLTIDAATFLLRLFAYDSPRVDEWKKRLKSSLAGCCHCIKGLGEAKTSSRKTLVAQWASTPSGICVVLTPTPLQLFWRFLG